MIIYFKFPHSDVKNRAKYEKNDRKFELELKRQLKRENYLIHNEMSQASSFEDILIRNFVEASFHNNVALDVTR